MRGAALAERDAALNTVAGGVGGFCASTEAHVFLKLEPICAVEADPVPQTVVAVADVARHTNVSKDADGLPPRTSTASVVT